MFFYRFNMPSSRQFRLLFVFIYLVLSFGLSNSIMSKYIKICYDNKYDDYSEGSAYIVNNSIAQPVLERYDKIINKLLSNLKRQWTRLESSSDSSIYTGYTGVALLYYHLALKTKNKDYFLWPQQQTMAYLQNLKGRRVGFLNGDSGPLALGMILFFGQNSDLCQKFLDKLLALQKKVTVFNKEMPDEVLYGRIGYLYALLFVNRHISNNVVGADIIRQVVVKILESGEILAEEKKSGGPPLQYEWHGKNYFGAAHGVAGILYILLQAKAMLTSHEMNDLVIPTLDWLIKQQFITGNFPSSENNLNDRLVQWCHGAPGFVQLLSKAYQITGNETYLNTALECGEVVWRRGLLKKGYSLCHGVAGNGYTFLTLYQLTNDVKHLHRAACFGDWCTKWPGNQHHEPDRPFSLFEGIAGIIYFLSDLKEPMKAAFPAYTIPA